MNYLDNVQRGIDYIEAHLNEEVAIADVARHSGISHWHFQRIFKALTGETLKTYIRSRRFANALDELSGGDAKILDLALVAGFDSQASFTRAFKKAFGITPGDYRKSHAKIPFLRKVRFDSEYIAHLHGGVSLEPRVSMHADRTLVGLRTQFFGGDSQKNNFANKIPALWNAFLPRMNELVQVQGSPAYGVICQTAAKTDLLEYTAAIDPASIDKLPLGMKKIHVPRATYAVFEHHGFVTALDKTVNYIYSSWLLQSRFRHSYGIDLEIYGEGYIADSADSVIHYAIPLAEV
jgi:AraC family transcriptional regulator